MYCINIYVCVCVSASMHSFCHTFESCTNGFHQMAAMERQWKWLWKLHSYGMTQYPLVMTNIANWKDPPFFMGKSTISMAIFNSYVAVYQRVIYSNPISCWLTDSRLRRSFHWISNFLHIKHIVRAFWPLPDAALTHLEELIVRFCRNQDTQPFIIVDMVFPTQTTEEYNK